MKYVLFDIDGTMLSSGGAGQAAMEASLREEFGAVRPVSDISTAGRTDRAIMHDLFAYYGIPQEPANWERFLGGYLRRLPAALRELEGRVLPGVEALIAELAVHPDVSIGLLTGNLRKGASAKLKHFGLDEPFTWGGFGDRHFDRDDVARDAWSEIRARDGNATQRDVWVIGDTPADIRCARAIEARVLAVATGQFRFDELSAHDPDAAAVDLSDVDRWIELFTQVS